MTTANWTHILLTYGQLSVEMIYDDLLYDENYEELSKIVKARGFLTEFLGVDFKSKSKEIDGGLLVGKMFMTKDEIEKIVKYRKNIIKNELLKVL